MILILSLAAAIAILLCGNIVQFFLFYKKKFENKKLIEALESLKKIDIDYRDLLQEFSEIRGKNKMFETHLYSKLEEIKSLQKVVEELNNTKHEVDTQFKVNKKEIELLNQEKLDWENQKNRLLKELSYNIIQENTKNIGELQNNNKNEIEKIVKNFNSQTIDIFEKIKSLDDDTKKAVNEFDIIKRGLLNPGGAGLTSETTLYNLLKNSNLKQKINKDDIGDYILQTSFNTKNCEEDIKRPDCIIYLPNNNYVIIDSKSSKHFLELQNAIDKGNEEEAKTIKKQIKSRINTHFEDLKSKDYQKSQADYLGLKKENDYTIITIMFLQTEKMLEIIREIEPTFEEKTYNQNIHVLTPIGLINLLNMAKFSIQKEKQKANVEAIGKELKDLFKNIEQMFRYSDSLGGSLKKSLNEYTKFANVFNKNLILRAEKIQKLGVGFEKADFSIKKLNTYNIEEVQSVDIVDSEAEEVGGDLLIEG